MSESRGVAETSPPTDLSCHHKELKPPSAPPTGRTILVVEDSHLLLDLLKSFLSDEGHEVLIAPDAPDALELLSTLPVPPDLLIADLRLGSGMSGLHLIETALDRWPGMKGILMSGEHVATTTRYGTIGKPFRAEELLALIADIFDGGAAGLA